MQRFNVASTSILRRLITCDEIFRRPGGNNIGSLALGTRRSNIDADTALLRRIDVNIASFDNVTRVFEGWGSKHPLTSSRDKTKQYCRRCSALAPHRLQILRRLRYGMRPFSFTNYASPNSYFTIVHDSQ